MFRWCRNLCRSPEEDENVERGNWSNQCEFILATLGSAIGLGNVWRYPYLVYKYGGTSFVMAYWLMLFIIVLPIFVLELSLGQFTSRGPVKLIRTVFPAGEGVALSIMLTQVVMSVYYNALFGWSLLYMFSSMRSPMPWGVCSNDYNDNHCVALPDWEKCGADTSDTLFYFRNRCYNASNSHPHIGAEVFDELKQCTEEVFSAGKIPAECAVDLKIQNRSWIASRYSTLGQTLVDLRFSYKLENEEGRVVFLDSKLGESNGGTLYLQISHDGVLNEEDGTTYGVVTGRSIFRYFNFDASDGPASLYSYVLRYCTDNKLLDDSTMGIRCARQVLDNFDYRSQYASQQFFTDTFASSDSSYSNFGGIKWEAALSFAFSWVLIAIGVGGGIKWTGKLVYVTATMPIIIIIILVIYGATLEGASMGYAFYVQRYQWDTLAGWDVWRDALTQILFSLSIGGGALTTFASYNRFHSDIFTHTMIIVLGNCLTSFVSGFGIFAVMGFMAAKLHISVPDLLKRGGAGLAFMTFAHATTVMPGGQFWGVVFFLNLGLLAIDSQFSMAETILTYIYDEFQVPRKKRWIVVISYCLVCFLLGLPHISRFGAVFLDLVDSTLFSFLVLLQLLVEIYIIVYFYGVENVVQDIYMMIGRGSVKDADGSFHFGRVLWNIKSQWYWAAAWYVFCPIGIGVLLLNRYYNY